MRKRSCLADMRQHSSPSQLLTLHHQHGASLLVVLMLMVVVGLMGLASMQLSVMGERSARNDRDYQIAWQAAEAALADAESDIEGEVVSTDTNVPSRPQTVFTNEGIGNFVHGCGSSGINLGLCLPADGDVPIWQTIDLAKDDVPYVSIGKFTGRQFNAAQGLQPEKEPRYIIEAMPLDESQAPTYRITAIGFGPKASTQVVLQSVYRK